MYSDRDGTATKQSQEIYDKRVKSILITTSLFASIGLSSAALEGDYTNISYQWKLSIWGLHLQPSGPLLWPILCLNTLNLVRQSGNPPAVYRGGLGGAVIALLSLYYHVYPLITDSGVMKNNVLVQIGCATLVLFLQLLIPQRPTVYTEEGRVVDAENSACALSRYTMSWCLGALGTATKATHLQELPALNYSSKSSSQPLLATDSKQPYVWRQILRERAGKIAQEIFIVLIRVLCVFAPAFCIRRLLACLESSTGTSREAWLWLLVMGGAEAGRAISYSQNTFLQWTQLHSTVGSQLTNSIFHKLLRRKNSHGQGSDRQGGIAVAKVPEVTTLLSADIEPVARFSAIGYLIISVIVSTAANTVFLYSIIGWQSTLVSLAATFATSSVHTYLAKRASAANKKSRDSRAETAKVLNEALYGLREIKFSAMEAKWETHIDRCRQEELQAYGSRRTEDVLGSAWETASPLIISAIALGCYMLMGGEVTPSVVFPMVSSLPSLQSLVSFLPELLRLYDRSISAASHIDQYLYAPEQESFLKQSESGQVSFHNATIAWPSDSFDRKEKPVMTQDRFSLRNLDLEFPKGELSVVSGKTGSGKSLLLAAIFGEVDLLSGGIESPSAKTNSPVAYVAQTPWLQNCTVEQNILFGSPMDKERYQKVVLASALGPDLAALPDGDQTVIGLRGVKFSGGQRARLSFARALYSSAELMILDDIFAAVDAHVANQIFDALTGELCQGRTRILATHHAALCLPSTKYRVHLDANKVKFAGTPDKLPAQSDAVEDEKPQERKEAAGETRTEEKEKATTEHFSTTEEAPKPSAFPVVKSYCVAAGGTGFVIVYVTNLVAKQSLDALTKYLFGRVQAIPARDATKVADNQHSNDSGAAYASIYWYAAAAAASVAIVAVQGTHRNAGIIRASNALFRRMTFKVLRMPLLWLDTASFGEIIKTFTVDIRRMDDRVLNTVDTITENWVQLVTILCVGLSASKYIGVLTVALIVWCAHVGSQYFRARGKLNLGGSSTMAPILEHVTSTSAGITTIRSFKAESQFIKEMSRYTDNDTLSHRYFWAFHDWVGLQLSLVGIVFTTFSCGFLLASGSVKNVAAVGFLLTFFGKMHRAIFNVINQSGHLAQFMDNVSSVVAYTELETEKLEGEKAPDAWPLEGRVEMEDFEVGYASHLPPALKSINFSAGAGQRIGIVGRTGAGKSSLTLSLLRLLEPRGGKIVIDGLDLADLKVEDIRSRVGFIPQDPTLFSGTIRSNLDYFQQVTIDEIKDALQRVGMLAEDGDEGSGLLTVDSAVSAGGANLSQGQRQLVCLARLLIRSPKVIILDEATSAVDNKTDTMIQDVIRTQFKGTVIVVAHRLRTVAEFDKIMVLSHGVVAEQGSPRMLLDKKGAFYELVRSSQDCASLEKVIRGE